MTKFFSKFRNDETGATAIEYGLIAALIALGLVATLGNTSTAIDNFFGSVDTELGNQQVQDSSAPAS